MKVNNYVKVKVNMNLIEVFKY